MSPELTNGIFAIVGALIGAFVTWIVGRKTTERRSIRVRSTTPTSIAVVTGAFRRNVKLLVEEKLVVDPGSFNVYISNSGNRAIENVSMIFEVSQNVSFLTWQLTGDTLLKESCVLTEESINAIRLNFPLLNPWDLLEIRFLTSHADIDLQIKFRQKDVRFSHIVRADISDPVMESIAELLKTSPFVSSMMRIASKPYREWLKRQERKN